VIAAEVPTVGRSKASKVAMESPAAAQPVATEAPKTPKASKAAKEPVVPTPVIAPRPNEAEAVDSESPVAAPTVGVTRLWISAGEEQGATVDSVRDFILGTTGEPAASVGRIDIRERHTFVDVPGDRAASFVSRLKRAEFSGKRIKAKVA
jgi:hypothetical protein